MTSRSWVYCLGVLLASGAEGAHETGRLILTSPAGGESWSAGSLHHITWKADRLPATTSLRAAYSTDGGRTWAPAGKAPAGAGKLLWKVPEALSRGCKIRLSVPEGPS